MDMVESMLSPLTDTDRRCRLAPAMDAAGAAATAALPERALGPAPDALPEPEREPGLLLRGPPLLLQLLRARPSLG